MQRQRRLRAQAAEVERRLWQHLRARQLAGAKFRRQQAIGRYVVDFVCFDARLVVELDGGQHAVKRARDARRTADLETSGYRVLRFWNNEVVDNPDGVLERIMAVLAERLSGTRSRAVPPHPILLPPGEKGPTASPCELSKARC